MLTAHGLHDFPTEYSRSVVHIVDGLPLRVLSLSRIIDRKRATNRAKDRAQLPILETTLLAKRARSDAGPA